MRNGTFQFELLVILNWAGKSLLCTIFQFPFIAPYKDRKRYKEKHCKHNSNCSYRPGQAMDLFT